MHFHYAAFVTLTLMGLAGRVIGRSRVCSLVVAGAIAGTPILAAGITFSRTLEMLGAALMAVSLWTFAVLHGGLNAFGFGLCGLLAWTLSASPWPPAPVQEGRRQG